MPEHQLTHQFESKKRTPKYIIKSPNQRRLLDCDVDKPSIADRVFGSTDFDVRIAATLFSIVMACNIAFDLHCAVQSWL